MKIWKNFKTLADARPSLATRNCFSCCYLCKNTWAKTETSHVHMIQPIVDGKIDTRFICDSCEAEASNPTDEDTAD